MTLIAHPPSTTTHTNAPYQRTPVPERFSRSDWFRDARFGMFIHWGVYSLIGEGEWVRSHQRMSYDDYAPWVERFNPQHVNFDAWAELAKAAGMQYAVFTAKHHDGYCMFDSSYTDYSSAKRAPKRDFVAEFLAAFRKQGIKVGLYFTLLDWAHPDYPAYGDMFHPMRDNPEFAAKEHNFDRYLDYMHAQIEELCCNYGDLDILWFDFSYADMRGETWRASELMRAVRRWQPNALIDNRLEVSGDGFGSIVTNHPSPYCGDFVSPEQVIPPRGIIGEDGAPVPWEACVTLNNHWAWHHSDQLYKTSETIVRKLVEVVSKGGNLLLNVGPDGDGVIPVESRQVLQAVGRWLTVNEAAIRGTEGSTLPKPEWGRWTQRGNKLYAHVLEQPIGPIPLFGLAPEEIKQVRLLAEDRILPLAESWVIDAYSELAFVSLGDDPSFSYPLPDHTNTVLEIELQ